MNGNPSRRLISTCKTSNNDPRLVFVDTSISSLPSLFQTQTWGLDSSNSGSRPHTPSRCICIAHYSPTSGPPSHTSRTIRTFPLTRYIRSSGF